MLISSYLYIATVTTAIYTLSLHDALPISKRGASHGGCAWRVVVWRRGLNICHLRQGALVLGRRARILDRKSTRLNSSHVSSSYAVFCLKNKTESKDDRV